jgi:hypothetical protein
MQNRWKLKEGVVIYSSNNIEVWEDTSCNRLYFESKNNHLYFMSYDYFESVAGLMRLDAKLDSGFWKIALNESEKYDISINRILYWITGGDNEWKTSDHKEYKYDWYEVEEIFRDRFEDIILDIVRTSETLLDVRNGIIEKISLPIVYEFALNNDLIKV